MSFCRDCGVEIEYGHGVCPLCNGPLEGSSENGPPASQAYPKAPAVQRENDLFLRRRGFIMLILSVVLTLTAMVCIVLDRLYSENTWSAYVVLGLGLVWTLSFMALYFFRSLLPLSLSMLFAVQAFLMGIDYLDGRLDWALTLALPILGWISAGIFVVWLSLHVFMQRPGFALSGFLGALALVCMGTDLSISVYLGHAALEWSVVVLFALVPLALVLVVLQSVWIRSSRFRRFLQW